VVVTGLSQPQTIYEIMGRKDALSPQRTQLCAHYAAGLAAYREGRWDEARAAFSAALEAKPEDGPSIALLARVENLSRNPPPTDWDGLWHMESK
jgi:adenylate cyclase